jgi:hypothetical protein
MKRLALIACCALAALAASGQAHFGIKLGGTVSSYRYTTPPVLNPEEVFRHAAKAGFQAGAFALLPLGKRGFFLQPEALYLQKGFNTAYVLNTPVQPPARSTHLDYLSLPLLAGFQSEHFAVQAGPEINVLLRHQIFQDGERHESPLLPDRSAYRDSDLGFLLGVQYQPGRFLVSLRYGFGLSPFRISRFVDMDGRSLGNSRLYHRHLQVSAGYVLW